MNGSFRAFLVDYQWPPYFHREWCSWLRQAWLCRHRHVRYCHAAFLNGASRALAIASQLRCFCRIEEGIVGERIDESSLHLGQTVFTSFQTWHTSCCFGGCPKSPGSQVFFVCANHDPHDHALIAQLLRDGKTQPLPCRRKVRSADP